MQGTAISTDHSPPIGRLRPRTPARRAIKVCAACYWPVAQQASWPRGGPEYCDRVVPCRTAPMCKMCTHTSRTGARARGRVGGMRVFMLRLGAERRGA